MLSLLTVTLQLYHILNVFKALDVCSSGGHTAALSHFVLIGETCFLTRYYLVLERLYNVLMTMVSDLLNSISLFFLLLSYVAHLYFLIQRYVFTFDAANVRSQG